MKLQLSIRATGLTNVAGAFKGTSDPFAVVTLLPIDRDAKPEIIGKTEVIKNTLDPDFVNTFLIDYEFGTPVNLLIKIFDKVTDGDNIPMASARFEIGNILGAKGNSKAKKCKSGGTIFVRVTEAKDCGLLSLKMSGVKLTNVEGFLKKSDPFYQFKRKDMGQRGSEWNVIHKSDKVKNNLNPNWDEEGIDVFALCGGNLDLPLVLEVLDFESDGNHVLMGSVETSVNGLIATKETDGFELSKVGESAGTVVVETAEVVGLETGVEPPENLISSDEVLSDNVDAEEDIIVEAVTVPTTPATFVDYINGGCEISLSVAIDFTGSNGDPRQPGTPHYMDPLGGRNDYEKAICAIGGILSGYDSEKNIPVWGFGAKIQGTLSHCFQCGPDAEADGINGVLDAYRKTFASGLVMSSPTDITEVLSAAAAFARSGQEHAASEGKQKYSVLLILTDGSVSDIESTIETLNLIADSPLSVVIVGIGNSDFSEMQFLDDSGSGLDVCQFVEFNSHSDDFSSLTRATMLEIPNQLTSYFNRHGIRPNPLVEVVEEDIVVDPVSENDVDLDFKFGDDGKIEATPQESSQSKMNSFLRSSLFAGAVGVGIGVALNYAFEQNGSEEVVRVEHHDNYFSGDVPGWNDYDNNWSQNTESDTNEVKITDEIEGFNDGTGGEDATIEEEVGAEKEVLEEKYEEIVQEDEEEAEEAEEIEDEIEEEVEDGEEIEEEEEIEDEAEEEEEEIEDEAEEEEIEDEAEEEEIEDEAEEEEEEEIEEAEEEEEEEVEEEEE